jgi:hypothetical protein
MEQHDADIVTGVYVTGAEPHMPVLWGGEPGNYRRILDVQEADVLPITAAGAGCLLVKRSVFDKIAEKTGELPFDIRDQYSEDFSFFVRCHEVGGLKILCDWRINPGHFRSKAYELDDWDPDQFELEYEEIS